MRRVEGVGDGATRRTAVGRLLFPTPFTGDDPA
jgi:hypothetical protein